MNVTPGTNRSLHLTALAAGVIALVVLFALPGGVPSYLVAVCAGVIAALVGHRAVRRPGALLWAAVVGLVFVYLELLTAVGLLLVRLARIFTS